MTNYQASFKTDGSGDWSITLPVDCSEHDLDALLPVVNEIKTFLTPTVAESRYLPTGLPA